MQDPEWGEVTPHFEGGLYAIDEETQDAFKNLAPTLVVDANKDVTLPTNEIFQAFPRSGVNNSIPPDENIRQQQTSLMLWSRDIVIDNAPIRHGGRPRNARGRGRISGHGGRRGGRLWASNEAVVEAPIAPVANTLSFAQDVPTERHGAVSWYSHRPNSRPSIWRR